MELNDWNDFYAALIASAEAKNIGGKFERAENEEALTQLGKKLDGLQKMLLGKASSKQKDMVKKIFVLVGNIVCEACGTPAHEKRFCPFIK